MKNIGYIRVSSNRQNLERQLKDVVLDRVFQDKISAKDTNRPELKKCIEYLREGDTLHLHSLDRLARNLTDLEKLIKDLNEQQVTIKFHKENLIFSHKERSNHFDKLFIRLLAIFSDFERSIIRDRQLEGIEIAKSKGLYKGGKRKIDRKPILDAVKAGMKKTQIQKQYNISSSHLYRIIAENR